MPACLCLALSVLALSFGSLSVSLSAMQAHPPQHALAHCNNSSAVGVDVTVSVVVKLPYYANTHKTHGKSKTQNTKAQTQKHTQRKIAQKHVQQM